MNDKKRTARPGDICVLLVPGQDEADRLQRMQTSLQLVFGGAPHQPVHLTCQRFDMAHDHPVSDIIQYLEARLATVRPVPLVAVSMIQIEHRFWQSRLLRWRIRVTDRLQHLVTAIEDGLVAARIAPHYPRDSGWMPTLVTALEGVLPEEEPERRLSEEVFPLHLFTGRRVVLSRILGHREFEILWTEEL
jgi:hypothetical protein